MEIVDRGEGNVLLLQLQRMLRLRRLNGVKVVIHHKACGLLYIHATSTFINLVRRVKGTYLGPHANQQTDDKY